VSGFFGMVRFDGALVEERLLETVADALSSRGPDGRNLWKQNNIGGCFTWMKTGPAKQASQQPVIWGNRYWLWGDIRLDGKAELLQQIEGNGNPGNPDRTSEELLLHAWERWGPVCLDLVIGDFSLALWDDREGILWCARDFIGARPFYYSYTRKIFCFSNTLQVLRLVPEISNELDEAFLGDFLIEGWNVDGSRTVYREIKRLKAGHILKLSKSAFEVRRVQRLPIEEPLQLERPEEYLEAYRDLLRTSVRDRLPGDAVSLYLSGGLDSGSVCATASQIAEAQGKKDRLKAYTVSWNPFFDDPEPGFAKLTAKHLGLNHEVLQEEYLRPFEGVEEEGKTSPEPNQEIFFAKAQRNHQKVAAHANVVLSGDGGDDVLVGQAWPYLLHLLQNREWRELARDFGGYFWTHKAIPPLRGGFRAKILKLVQPEEDQLEGYPEWLNPEFERRANLKQRWLELQSPSKNTQHPLHPEAYDALHDGFWAAVLETEDAGWTRVRLETRGPLLDLRILKFLLRLPPVPWCVKKELIRLAMKDSLPREIVERPKTPFPNNPIEALDRDDQWIEGIAKAVPGYIESFVNWRKWCETLYHSKGSLRWIILRPVSLFHWLKAVENR
jgi:asparagine synthase (glutamine-hydrolysing)